MVIEAIEKSQKGQGLNGSEKLNCYDWHGINMGDSDAVFFKVDPSSPPRLQFRFGWNFQGIYSFRWTFAWAYF